MLEFGALDRGGYIVLISVESLVRWWRLHPGTIVHIGAHEGEELEAYVDAGWGEDGVLWVEAIEEKANALRQKLEARGLRRHVVESFLAWDLSGDSLNFHIANNGQSSSALDFGLHAVHYPEIVVASNRPLLSRRFDEAVADPMSVIGLVNLDVQGAELRVLKGMGSLLDRVEAVYSEINTSMLYEGCDLFPQLDEWLRLRGFQLVDWLVLPEGWGDALWIRSEIAPRFLRSRRAGRRIGDFAQRLRRWMLR